MLDTFCGSPPYAAPELFADNCYHGELVDIWAMGIMLYYMVSGTMPFRGETIPQLKARILEGNYDMPTDLTPVCQDLIRGLLTKNPKDRFVMDDVFSSVWLRTSSTVLELNPSKKNLKGKTNSSRSNLQKLSRDNAVADSSAAICSSVLDVSFNAGTEGVPDREILQSMEMLGIPISDVNSLVGEPRNPIAGTYRILLHRKHLSELTDPEGEHSDTPERKKKLSTGSSGGQSITDDLIKTGSGGNVMQKPPRGNYDVVNKSKPMSKICAIL